MDSTTTRWFEFSRHELKALILAAVIIIAGLYGLMAWERVKFRNEFRIYQSTDIVPLPKRININTAQAHELQFLPRIGETRSQAIVDYREKNGYFDNIEELVNIRGISYSTIEEIKQIAICTPPSVH